MAKGQYIADPGLIISNTGWPHLHWQMPSRALSGAFLNEFVFLRETYYATILNQPKYQGYIKDWLVLGPFSNASANRLMADKLNGQEASIEPSAGSGINGQTWKAYDNLVPGGVDFASALSPAPYSGYSSKVAGNYVNSVGYAHVYVNSPIAYNNAQLWLGYNDGVRVWVNGNHIFTNDSDFVYSADDGNEIHPDMNKLTNVNLVAGWNRILIKLSQDSNDKRAVGAYPVTPNAWRFSAKLTDSAGNALTGLTYQVDKPGILPSNPPVLTITSPRAGQAIAGSTVNVA